MAQWIPRSTTPLSESYTPPSRAHSLAPSTIWRSRSRSQAASSDGSSPPPDEDRSDPGELGDEYEEEDDSPHQIHLENLSEPEDRGRPGKSLQEIPNEVVQPPALPPPRSASSQAIVNQAPRQAAPYYNRSQKDPHYSPLQNTGNQMHIPTQQNPPIQNMHNQTYSQNPGDQMLSSAMHPGISNPSASLTNTSNPINIDHQTTLPPGPLHFSPYSCEEMSTRLVYPVEQILIACGYDNSLGDSSQDMPNRTLQAPSQFDKDKDQLMFNFLAKLGMEIARSAQHRPLLQMNRLAYSQLPINIDPKERAQHINDVHQLVHINEVLGVGVSICENMLERFRLLQEANVKRINYTLAYLSILRRVSNDVLYQLFDCCVHEAGISPWTLSAVSKQFRAVALSCPKIWDSIRLDINYKYKFRYFDGYDVCRTVEELGRSLIRSGGRPLTIKIDECTKEMAAHLRNEALGRCVNIRYNAPKNSVDVERALFGYSLPKTALGIASLEVYQHCDQARAKHLVRWIEQHKPRQICYLRSSDYIALSIPRQPSVANQWWSQLQTFEASFPYPRGADPTVQQRDATIILNILEHTKNTLTELKLSDITMDITTDQLHLPNLQKLALITVKSWWMIVGSRVTEFELWPHDRPPPEKHTVTFPKLKTLRYRSGNFAMRGILSAPELELLIYHVGRFEGRFIWESDIWEGEDPKDTYTIPGLTPTELHLHDVQIRGPELVRGLGSLSDLEKFHLYSSRVRAGLLKPLAGEKQKLLPNLTEIIVEIPWMNGVTLTRDYYTTLFQRIAKERDGRHGMKELKSFKVEWSERLEGGTTVFVSPPEQPVSIYEWTVVKDSKGKDCHALITGSGAST